MRKKMDKMEMDLSFFQEFERGFNPRTPERSTIPAHVLGYGEISTVLEISTDNMRHFACKRMPMFRTETEIENYLRAYEEYLRVMEDQIGLNLVPSKTAWIREAESGTVILYILQEKMPSGTIGHQAIHDLPDRGVLKLVHAVLIEMKKVFDFNRAHQRELELGLDGQISNWSILDYDPRNPQLVDPVRLAYFDTSTPLMQKDGQEQLDPELFLRSAPSFLVWILRLFFVEDLLTRYYDFRRVVVDLIANFYKEQRESLIPDLIDAANDILSTEGSETEFSPITTQEIRSYYREDATIWRLYLSFRKVDRALHKLLGRDYPYVLPEKILR
jgi:hypothetical protein